MCNLVMRLQIDTNVHIHKMEQRFIKQSKQLYRSYMQQVHLQNLLAARQTRVVSRAANKKVKVNFKQRNQEPGRTTMLQAAGQHDLHQSKIAARRRSLAANKPRKVDETLTQQAQLFNEMLSSKAVKIQMSGKYASCRFSCPCACHKQHRTTSPSILNRWVGTLIVHSTASPITGRKCDHMGCQRSQPVQFSVEYRFPAFILNQVLRMRANYMSDIGPSLQLQIYQRVPDSSPAIEFAMNGNINRLKDLFRRGVASPSDVSNTRGYSLLRWALHAKQHETCRFLLHMGSDADCRPFSPDETSPRHKANDLLLHGGHTKEAEKIYREIASETTEFVDEQNYTILHNIILGLASEDLVESLRLHPQSLEAKCGFGRTPLSWAACRGDQASVITLLTYGADPDTLDLQKCSPIHHAAGGGHTASVKLLLDASYRPKCARSDAEIISALECACRNANDLTLINTLLNAANLTTETDIDSTMSIEEGITTSLLNASRRDDVDMARLLLEYGAKIDSTVYGTHSALTIAIMHNSHRVLELLLYQWRECTFYIEMGHLLGLAAAYADAETMRIIPFTDRLQLEQSGTCNIADCQATLIARYDASEDLMLAFNHVLELLVPKANASERVPSVVARDEYDFDVEKFEDALEHPLEDSIKRRLPFRDTLML